MLSVASLKPILAIAGINHLSVKFEPENRQVRVRFDHYGRHSEEIISFEQIEQLFPDGQEGVQLVDQPSNAGQKVSQQGQASKSG